MPRKIDVGWIWAGCSSVSHAGLAGGGRDSDRLLVRFINPIAREEHPECQAGKATVAAETFLDRRGGSIPRIAGRELRASNARTRQE